MAFFLQVHGTRLTTRKALLNRYTTLFFFYIGLFLIRTTLSLRYIDMAPFDTGWRRLIGCLKLQVIFCKRATNYRALLQKMTYGDKAFNESSPPCV